MTSYVLMASLLSTWYFIVAITMYFQSSNNGYDSDSSESKMVDGSVNEINSEESFRVRRDSLSELKSFDNEEVLSHKDKLQEAEYMPRLVRRIIFPNETILTTLNDSTSTRMLNDKYYKNKETYRQQQILKKRFKGVVPAGCYLIEGLPPAGGADNASAPAAPAAPVEETTTTAPPARRRKRDDETTTAAAPAPAAAENPGATTPPPGAAAPATTTVITTTTPKPVSLVCPPSTTTPTTTIPTTTPAAAAAAAPVDVTTTTAAPPPSK